MEDLATTAERAATAVPETLAAPRNGMRFDVAMLTSVHWALDDRIFHREAKTIAAAGVSCCVIGPYPASAFVEGVWIEALPKQTSRLKRAFMGWTVLRKALQIGKRVFIFHDPELFGVGLLLRLCGKHVVYDCHENLPMQLLQKDWIPKPLRWVLLPWVWLAEWLGARLLSGVISAAEVMLPRFPKKRSALIRNFPIRAALEHNRGGIPIQLRDDVVVYAGGLSRIRGIRELVAAFRAPELSHAQLWLLGPFESEEFQREIMSSLPPNARWLGLKDHSEVLKTYPATKIGACLLYPTPSHRHSQPIKLYEYMAAGLPIVASNFPEFAPVLEGCGVLVNPYDVDKIRTALVAMLSDSAKLAEMSLVAQTRALESFVWEKEGQKLVDLCRQLGAGPGKVVDSHAGVQVQS